MPRLSSNCKAQSHKIPILSYPRACGILRDQSDRHQTQLCTKSRQKHQFEARRARQSTALSPKSKLHTGGSRSTLYHYSGRSLGTASTLYRLDRSELTPVGAHFRVDRPRCPRSSVSITRRAPSQDPRASTHPARRGGGSKVEDRVSHGGHGCPVSRMIVRKISARHRSVGNVAWVVGATEREGLSSRTGSMRALGMRENQGEQPGERRAPTSSWSDEEGRQAAEGQRERVLRAGGWKRERRGRNGASLSSQPGFEIYAYDIVASDGLKYSGSGFEVGVDRSTLE